MGAAASAADAEAKTNALVEAIGGIKVRTICSAKCDKAFPHGQASSTTQDASMAAADTTEIQYQVDYQEQQLHATTIDCQVEKARLDEEVEDAAIKIQALHRGNASRKEVKAAKLEQEALQVEKARLDKEMEDAAIRIQALHRGKASRKEVEAAKLEQEALQVEKARLDKEMEDAAIKIQALHRGNASRKEVEAAKLEQARSNQIQAQRTQGDHPSDQEGDEGGKEEADDDMEPPNEDPGPEALQVEKARLDKEMEGAAIKIQALHRGNASRKEVEAAKLEQEALQVEKALLDKEMEDAASFSSFEA